MLDAARQIFLEKGYAGTSIDEVVQRTGGSKASVYKYFGSKEGLFAEMFGTHCQVFLATLQIPNELSDNLEQTLTQFAERVLVAFVDPERVAKHGLGLLADFLQRHHQAGMINCPHPDIAAIQFMEMIKGHVQWRALLGLPAFPEHLNRENYIKEAIRVFLRGYQV